LVAAPGFARTSPDQRNFFSVTSSKKTPKNLVNPAESGSATAHLSYQRKQRLNE
jgi:hypothetical protein